MQLTITEAAKLYRKQRKTLYRHIDSGRLSCSVRGDGHRVLDLSELMRCYGNPPGPMPTDDTPVTRDAPQGDTLVTQAVLDELRALRQEVRELKEAMLRLPAPEQPQRPQERREDDTTTDDDPNGLRALVRAMRDKGGAK